MGQAPALVAKGPAREAVNRVSLPFLRIQERRLLLSTVDALLSGGILLGAYQLWKLRVHPGPHNMAAIPWVWVLGGAVSWLVVSWLAGSYELEVADRLGATIKRTLTVTVFIVIEGLAAYLLFLKTYPRPALAIALPMAPLAVLIWRSVYAAAFSRPTSKTRMLVLGARGGYDTLLRIAQSGTYFQVAGFAAVEGLTGAQVTAAVENAKAHRIVVTPGVRLTDEVVAGLTAAIERGVEVLNFNAAYEEMAGKVAVDHAGDHWLAALPTRSKSSALEQAVMRAVDVVGAVAGGLITVVALPVLALAIRLTSPGPVFYSQERLGRGGRPFSIYKLRTMRVDAECHGAQWAGTDDPRVTPVGRFLRCTHIDELPQLLNVLRGEMSLVGPRPERPEFTESLSRDIPFYRLRLSVRPGLTGLKQIRVGYAATPEEHLEVLRHDLYYIKHRSLALNLTIIAQTLGSVVGRDGR